MCHFYRVFTVCPCVPTVEDAEYMIMNCPSGGPSSDLREGSVAEALDSAEHPLSSATSSEWLRRGVRRHTTHQRLSGFPSSDKCGQSAVFGV